MPTRRSSSLLALRCVGCRGGVSGAGTVWCTHCRDRWGVVPGWWEPEPGGVAGWAAAHYAGPVRRAVLLGKRGAARGLVELLGARLPADCLPHGAVVSWVPAHPRRAWRSPDGAAVLAAALARREGLLCHRLLRRSMLGRRQAGRDRDERRAQGPDLGLRARGPVPPAVVLVDDVRTTGASLDEAAEVLRQAGARHVMGITVAIALDRGSVGAPPSAPR